MKRSSKVRVFAPATVANVSCGFDIFGFAVDFPGDEAIVALNNDLRGVKITSIEGDDGRLPKDPQKNTAGVAAGALLEYLKEEVGVSIALKKRMPFGSGLGSSAASAAASVLGVNFLLGEPLSRKELLPFAIEAERAACGMAHADNVAPSLMGGFILIRSYHPLDVFNLPVPENLSCVVVHPDMVIPTKKSRDVLQSKVDMKDVVSQCGNVSALTLGLLQSDFRLIKSSLHDAIVEPQRAGLIRGFYEVKSAALKEGALGCGISGSGPSVFALTDSMVLAEKIGVSMKRTWKEMGIFSKLYCSKINIGGAKIIENQNQNE